MCSALALAFPLHIAAPVPPIGVLVIVLSYLCLFTLVLLLARRNAHLDQQVRALRTQLAQVPAVLSRQVRREAQTRRPGLAPESTVSSLPRAAHVRRRHGVLFGDAPSGSSGPATPRGVVPWPPAALADHVAPPAWLQHVSLDELEGPRPLPAPVPEHIDDRQTLADPAPVRSPRQRLHDGAAQGDLFEGPHV